jgi:ATP adenylyltransferase/5',5'''-P-1,P-4-tetraphosphate phosphorylase II
MLRKVLFYMTNPVFFDLHIGKDKPYSSKHDPCPFCHPESLTHILKEEKDLIWLMNKYPVFHDTWPTVIIETARHDADIPDYTPEKLHQVITFGVTQWLQLSSRKDFRSVLYFRSHGPHSGGSLAHPHSQIMGMYHTDYQENITRENFDGPLFHEDADCYASLSSYPISNMAEFTITLKKDGRLEPFADTLQKVIQFILRDFPIPIDSYNLFFYKMKNIHVKVFPRHIASPLYLGYKIVPIMDELSTRDMMKKLTSPAYFGD